MQWLIDIIAANVIATIGIPPVFINRGDPAVVDYTIFNFTKDDAWHDLDLSIIVPAGASAVSLMSKISDGIIFRYIWFRAKGNVNEANISPNFNQVAGIAHGDDHVVPLDTNRIIQYKSNLQVLAVCDLTVKGWWL